MKTRLPLLFLLLLSVPFALACKAFKKSDETKLVLTYKTDRNGPPTTKELVGKQSLMTVSESTASANGQTARIVIYSIYVSNYDADAKALQREMPKADNQIKVEIQVVGPEGSTATTPLKPGTYDASQFADGINKFNKALDIRVRVFEKGTAQEQGISIVNPRKGFVKINSVDDEKVTGEIDMSDDFRSVKGAFSAVIVK